MINRIVIDNFKSIRHLDLELRPLNVLIGANGSGKSNLIGFLEMWENMKKQNLQTYIAEKGGANQLLHFGLKTSTHLKGTFFFEGRFHMFSLKPDEQAFLYLQEEELAFWKDGVEIAAMTAKDIGKKESNILFDSKLDEPIAKPIFDKASIKIYHFNDTSPFSSLRQKSNIDDNRVLRADGANLPSILYLMQQVHPKKFKLLEATVRSVSAFFKEFVLVPDRFSPNLIQIEWRGQDPDFPFFASHLSDGTLRFIAIATALLQPAPPALIVIDEPELGLHPFAIGKLAALIRTASHHHQIMIATQSSSLVDEFEPEDIVTVDWRSGQSTFTRHTTEQLSIWLDDYSLGEIWDKNVIGGRP